MHVVRRRLHRLAAAIATGVPSSVREVGLALAARAVDGPAVLPGPPPGPVLVLAAHPDDETIGCGGAIARHVDRGDIVRVLVATSGEATSGRPAAGDDVRAAREAECRAACAELGTGPPVFARLPDGDLAAHTTELAAVIAEQRGDWRTVYVPSLLDPHRDHRAANLALARTDMGADVYGYEVWSPGPVDVLLDVTGAYARKEAALRCYATALDAVDYVRSAAGLAAYRSAAGGLGGRGMAEGFLRLQAPEHAAFTARLA